MKRSFLFFLLLLNISVFAQSNLSWYKTLKGTIDKYAVTMHLHKAGHLYAGYYYYDSQQQPIYFIGDDTTVKEKIRLISYADPDETEYFTFTINAANATGEWKRTEARRALVFSAMEVTTNPQFTYVFTSGSTRLRPKWKESPEANYQAASIWPLGKSGADEAVKKEIRDAFLAKNSSEPIGVVLLKNKKGFLSDYLSENKNVKDDELKESSIAYNLEEDDKMLIAFQSSKLLVLSFNSYMYTGGAHGNYGTSYTGIDLTSTRVLTLNDVISESGRKNLQKLLEKNFRRQYHLKPTDSLSEAGLFENFIKPNENFYVTGKGIGFNYVPYEIGPFAMGEINIFIPFTDLRAYLTESFKKLVE